MDYPITPVAFTLRRPLLAASAHTNRTIPYDFRKCEETGRIDNFAKAAGLMAGPHEGIFFNDSDLQGGRGGRLLAQPPPRLPARRLPRRPDRQDAGAQEDDGYLYT